MKLRAWGVLGVAVAAGVVATGMAPPLRITTLVPMGLGVSECGTGDGMAKLKYYIDPVDGPSIEAHVHLHKFAPLCTYSILVETDTGLRNMANIVVTNSGGNGNCSFHFPVSAEPVAAALLVYRDEFPNGEYDAVRPDNNEDEIRAFGIESP